MKVALCIPYHGDVKARFAGSLFALGRAASHHDLNAILHTSSNLPIQRNKLATDALAWGADYLLWLDTDHTFPADTLGRLLAHGKDFVAANYRRRIPDRVVPASRGLDGELAGPKEGLEEVQSVGFGVCLIRREVFESTSKPWFDLELAPDGLTGLGEDYYFCRKAGAAGHSIYVDHALSREVGHVAETVLHLPR